MLLVWSMLRKHFGYCQHAHWTHGTSEYLYLDTSWSSCILILPFLQPLKPPIRRCCRFLWASVERILTSSIHFLYKNPNCNNGQLLVYPCTLPMEYNKHILAFFYLTHFLLVHHMMRFYWGMILSMYRCSICITSNISTWILVLAHYLAMIEDFKKWELIELRQSWNDSWGWIKSPMIGWIS